MIISDNDTKLEEKATFLIEKFSSSSKINYLSSNNINYYEKDLIIEKIKKEITETLDYINKDNFLSDRQDNQLYSFTCSLKNLIKAINNLDYSNQIHIVKAAKEIKKDEEVEVNEKKIIAKEDSVLFTSQLTKFNEPMLVSNKNYLKIKEESEKADPFNKIKNGIYTPTIIESCKHFLDKYKEKKSNKSRFNY